MKKLIALFVIMVACGLNANAQQKKAATTAKPAVANQQALKSEQAYNDAAIKDIATLSEFVKLNNDQKVTLKSLFTEKHRMYAQNLSDERKNVLAGNIEQKLKSVLDPAQLSKVQANAQLMNVLTH